MIARLTKGFNLLTNIAYFSINRKARPCSVPTQADTLLPFSINYLNDNPGAKRWRKQFGRGRASGKGKTCGRGIKGQRAREGHRVHVRSQGGQTPLQKRLPKYGRVKRTRGWEILDTINLSRIDYCVKRGVLDPTKKITIKTLIDQGVIHKKVKFGVKILAKGYERITYPLDLEVSDISKLALKQIKDNGGTVSLIFRTRLKMRQHMKPERFPLPLRDPITPAWRVQKLQRKQQSLGLNIKYRKPKWLVEEESKKEENQKAIKKSNFVYPVPIVENSGKIRKRKPEIFRQVNYKLP